MSSRLLFQGAILLKVALFLSCSGPTSTPWTERYLNDSCLSRYVALENLDRSIEFWQSKVEADPGTAMPVAQLAAYYAQRFRLRGDTMSLFISDSLLRHILRLPAGATANTYLALAGNAMVRHQFTEARQYVGMAEQTREEPLAVLLAQIDAEIELGHVDYAGELLRSVQANRTFEVFIRKARWEDARGEGDQAIRILEACTSLVSHKPGMMAWVYANIGDFQYRRGRFELAREAYLSALGYDAENLQAMKGLAWHALAVEENIAMAGKAIAALEAHTEDPILDYFGYHLATLKGDDTLAVAHARKFLAVTARGMRQALFSSWRIELMALVLGQTSQAVNEAKRFQSNGHGNTGQVMLAWALAQDGQILDATDLLAPLRDAHLHGARETLFLAEAFRLCERPYQANHYYTKIRYPKEQLGPALEARMLE